MKKRSKHGTLPLGTLTPNGKTVRQNLEDLIDEQPFFSATRRLIAANGGLRFYKDFCDVHGVAHHHAILGTCACCPLPENVRSDRTLARRAGLKEYEDRCPVHGTSPHYPITGKCKTCFTRAGTVREGTRGMRPTDGARAVARREGKSRYRYVCRVHGTADHHVGHGKCLICFTASGRKRVHIARLTQAP